MCGPASFYDLHVNKLVHKRKRNLKESLKKGRCKKGDTNDFFAVVCCCYIKVRVFVYMVNVIEFIYKRISYTYKVTQQLNLQTSCDF